MDLAVTHGRLWAGPDREWPDGQVEISGSKVSYAGPARKLPESPAQVIDAGGGLIMPGLVNAHCHAPMVLFRGLGGDMPLEAWLNEVMFPAEARWVDPEMTYLCGLLAAGEMLLSGTTCVLDSYFCISGAARAFDQAGIRAVAAQGVIDFPAPGVPDPARALDAAREFVTAWQGRSRLITPAIFAHSVYTCSPRTLAGVAALAAELGVNWYTHLAETRSEVEQAKKMHGQSPARHLDSLGLLGSLQAAVHGVWLDDQEIALLAGSGVSLIHCPESNQKLASGLAPVDRWLAAGLKLGLGTDGAASNNDLDMIGELGSAARSAKLAAGDPAALSAGRALEMALGGGAKAAGLEGVIGGLAPGMEADLMVLDTAAPHLTPLGRVPAALCYAAKRSDVRQVVVAGRQVVKDRKVLSFDLDEVMLKVNQLAMSLKE